MTGCSPRPKLRCATTCASRTEQGQFEVYYQPVVDARLAGNAEALLRWHHPQRGTFVAGEDFIDVAEHGGLISEIGHWVVREALATAAQWQGTVDHAVH